MDGFEYERIDKAISTRTEAIFSDPKRHRFYSVFAADEAEDARGPRGGKIRGRKTICAHCGHPAEGHADITEEL